MKSTKTKYLVLVLFISTLFSSDIKIQLNENFDFIGTANYDNVFKAEIDNKKKKLTEIDKLISNETDNEKRNILFQERFDVEQTTLDYKIKDFIQSLMLKYYDTKLIESRLHNMDDKHVKNQDYVYLKANISKVNKIVYTIGDKETNGISETILSVTGGIELYNISTGELYYSDVYTFGTKIKKGLDDSLTDSELLSSYVDNMNDLFDYLILEASKNYNPSVSEAVIVKKIDSNTFVIDKGELDGFISGKTLLPLNKEGSFDIIESSPKVSLVKTFNKDRKFKVGTKLNLFGNKNEDLNKPKVLVTEVEFLQSYMFDENLDYDKSTITQWFKDYLSTYCNLFIVPSDPREINNFQEEISMYGNTSSKKLLKRLIKPDYIIYPKIIYAYEIVNDGKTVSGISTSVSTLEILLELQLIDFNTGIILMTKRHLVSHDQQQSSIMNVDMNDLFPGVVKNGIIQMTKELSTDLTVTKIEASLDKGKKNKFPIKYLLGSNMKNGEIFKVYRKKDKIDDLDGNYIGDLEEYVGDARVEVSSDGLHLVPYMPWTVLKKNDIVRGYSSTAKISNNVISVRMKNSKDTGISMPVVYSNTKVDNQTSLPKNLVLSNYYYVASNNANFTPILDEKNQEFLEALKDVMNRGYYARTKNNSKNPSISFFSDVKSTIYKKDRPHTTRIDILGGSRIRLYDPNNLNDYKYKSLKGIERTIGDKKSSTRNDKKRSKKNKILKGLSDKDVNKEFFDVNMKSLDQAFEELFISIE